LTDRQRKTRDLLIILLAAFFFLGIALGSRDLWNPNEPTYGRVVVEMLESGNWLIPQLNGEPFAEKPILYYWLAAGVSKVLGTVSPVSLRAPVLLAGVLSVLLVYLLIEAYDGRRRALIGCALFATLYGVWFTARNAQMDSFVLLCTLSVIVALTRRLDHELSGTKAWLLAGVAAGLGFVAKGPVTTLVPGMVLFAYIVLGRRPWRRLLSGLPVGILTFLVFASPWYLALFFSGQTDALHETLVRQNFSRFVSAWDHQQPWWYYLKYFWITFAPWSWFVPIVAVSTVSRRKEEARPAQLLAWIWLLAPLVFFSLSQSKREPYLLPAAPAVAWLVAWLFDRLLEGGLRRWQVRASVGVSVAIGIVFLLGGIALLWPGMVEVPGFETKLGIIAGVLLTAGLAALGTIAWRRTRPYAPAGVWVSFVLFYLFIAMFAHRMANPLKSHQPIAQALERQLPEGSRLYSFFGRFRTVRGGYPYYLGRAVPDLADEVTLRRTWDGESRPCLIYEEAQYRELVEGLADARVIFEGRVGSKTVRLVCADRGVSDTLLEAEV